MFFNLFSIRVSRSSISFNSLIMSSSLGPTYWPGGRSGDGTGSRGEGRKGSKGLLGSKLGHTNHRHFGFSLFLLAEPPTQSVGHSANLVKSPILNPFSKSESSVSENAAYHEETRHPA